MGIEEAELTMKMNNQDLKIEDIGTSFKNSEIIEGAIRTPLTEHANQETQPVKVLNVQDPEVNKDIKPFVYYVYGGNYPETVVNALSSRGNWV